MTLDNEKVREIELIFKKFFGYEIGQTKLIVSKIETARDLIVEEIQEKFKLIPFSSRLEKRALQLACAMSLLSYVRILNKLNIIY